MRDDRTPGVARSAGRWAAQALSWVVLLAALALLAVMVLVPRLGGAAPYTVLTGSMQPTYPPGSLLVVRPVPVEQIGTGTTITYQRASGDPTVVTHRVVALSYDAAGQKQFITQGDANSAVDTDPVLPVQVKGSVWYAVPHLGHLNNLLDESEHRMLVTAAAVLLAGYAAWMFARAGADRQRQRAAARAGAVVPAELGAAAARGRRR